MILLNITEKITNIKRILKYNNQLDAVFSGSNLLWKGWSSCWSDVNEEEIESLVSLHISLQFLKVILLLLYFFIFDLIIPDYSLGARIIS